MRAPHILFEVSWEVANPVGGVHRSISSRALEMAQRFGDDWVAIGPWRLAEGDARHLIDVDPHLTPFAERCRAAGLPVVAGRWRIAGAPRTLLVEWSGLNAAKDQLLSSLWLDHRVDSLRGGWDYIEPVLFGHAAGLVVERWWREMEGGRRPAVAHFHEWLTGAGLLHVFRHVPEIGTVATCHATALGRALAGRGRPRSDLGGRSPEEVADEVGVGPQQSLENAMARSADVLATVGEPSADEVARFHARTVDVVLPNGLDAAVLEAATGGATRTAARRELERLAVSLLGADMAGATLIGSGGRPEVHNKGFDLLIDSLALLAERPGKPLACFLFVPVGHGGPRAEVVARLERARGTGEHPPQASDRDPIASVATHVLFHGEGDALALQTIERGIHPSARRRVRVLHVPLRLDGQDPLLPFSYEALVQGLDFTCFPSLYDAWGYTPQESLALGVPTITSDGAGFGRFARRVGLGEEHGVAVLDREGKTFDEAKVALADLLARYESAGSGGRANEEACRQAAVRAAWQDLLPIHERAWRRALDVAQARVGRTQTPPPAVLPAAPAPSVEPTSRTPARRGPRLAALRVVEARPPLCDALQQVARNLAWTGDPEAHALWPLLSRATWEASAHDPLTLLAEAPRADLEAAFANEAIGKRVARVVARHATTPPSQPTPRRGATGPIAYLSAEFGLHESLPIYSGGLGVLAGDHLRAANDLGLSLVAVGLLYRQGYIRQVLSDAGEQIALPQAVLPERLPLQPVLDDAGARVRIELRLPGMPLHLEAWCASIGGVRLYLLDADVAANRPEARAIGQALYGGDREMRLRQEIVLGCGGVRLLDRLGIEPALFHINEGHGAFASLERIALLAEQRGLAFEEAAEFVRETTIFTTHTPIAAGHDRFDEALVRRHFADAEERFGIPWRRFYAWGCAEGDARFNMTGLAARLAHTTNGVSKLHAAVSRPLLESFAPALLPEEVPVRFVTNGIHLGAWTHEAIARLVAPRGEPPRGEDFAQRAPTLDLAALQAARHETRASLAEEVARRMRRTAWRMNGRGGGIERQLAGLADDALWIGFARRFATYKRADLLLRDEGRLAALVGSATRPVCVFYAGKAHPADAGGKALLARIARLTGDPRFVGRLFLLEDYDAGLARALVQGVDVWLNTPRAPLEASGTSGMKAAANGGLNLSIADGWWPEAYDGKNGWTIGRLHVGATPDGEGERDALDAASLYRLLEDEVVPLYFTRERNGLARGWLERVRHALATIPPQFSAERMVAEYRTMAYEPLAAAGRRLRARRHAGTRAAATARTRLEEAFAGLRIVSSQRPETDVLHPGDSATVRLDVHLNGLAVEDVVAEAVLAPPTDTHDPQDLRLIPLSLVGQPDPQAPTRIYRFEGTLPAPPVGSFSIGLRVRPANRPIDLLTPMAWA